MINFDEPKISSTKWEDSFFGGFYRIIKDHPNVVLDYNIDFDFAPLKGYFSYFEKQKILKIFLSKAHICGLTNRLTTNLKSEPRQDLFGRTFLKLIINKNAKIDAIEHLMKTSHEQAKEYSNLFEHYYDFIINSEIYYEILVDEPPSKGDKSGKSGEGESEESDGEGEGEKEESNESDGEGESNESESKEKESKESKESKSKESSKKSETKTKENKKKEKENKKEEELKKKKADEEKKKNIKLLIAKVQNITEQKFKESLFNIKEVEYVPYNSISRYSGKPETLFLEERSRKTTYTSEEKSNANNLVKLLDISFDPESDIVKNLRIGKLDISKIAEIPAGNIAVYKQFVENQITKPFSIVILCDESGSMESGSKIYAQHSLVKSLYLAFSDIIPQHKIYVYGHTGSSHPEIRVYQDCHHESFESTIDEMINSEHAQNYDGPAMERVYQLVRQTTQDRIIFLVLSDGAPCGYSYGGKEDIVNLKQIIEKCKRDEFVTIGIGIRAHHVKELYNYSTVISNLGEMPKKVSHIINHVVKTEFQ